MEALRAFAKSQCFYTVLYEYPFHVKKRERFIKGTCGTREHRLALLFCTDGIRWRLGDDDDYHSVELFSSREEAEKNAAMLKIRYLEDELAKAREALGGISMGDDGE